MIVAENYWRDAYVSPENMSIWKARVKQAVRGLADEEMQRRAWFGIGPEESSPAEAICQLVDDTDFEDFLERNDTGYTGQQIAAGKNLIAVIKQHVDVHKLKASEQINDPRWIKIQQAAKDFLSKL